LELGSCQAKLHGTWKHVLVLETGMTRNMTASKRVCRGKHNLSLSLYIYMCVCVCVLLTFSITPEVITPFLGCFMWFGVHGVCLAPRWSEMDCHMRDSPLCWFSLHEIWYICYYNDECSIYREHMVTIHERMRPLNNQ